MTVFQVDGGNNIEISPESSSVGILYPGERMDLIVECPAGAKTANSHLSVTLDAEYAFDHKGKNDVTNKFIETSLYRTKPLRLRTIFPSQLLRMSLSREAILMPHRKSSKEMDILISQKLKG
jgi:hypothetical protein